MLIQKSILISIELILLGLILIPCVIINLTLPLFSVTISHESLHLGD